MRIPSDRPRATVNTARSRAGRQERSPTIKQTVLSIYPPDGTYRPDVLEKMMESMRAVDEEVRAAAAYVFTGGLHEPSTAPWNSIGLAVFTVSPQRS